MADSWFKRNKELNRKRASDWYYNNLERGRSNSKRTYSANLDKCKEYSHWNNIRIKYNLSKKQWQNMFEEQEGCCAICNTHQSELKVKLHVDHDHDTGEVRSLLCNLCNAGLGMFKDNRELLLIAANYLEKPENG